MSLSRDTFVNEHARLWLSVLAELRLQMTTATFNAWFVDSVALSESGDVLVVGVRNAYAKDWLENRLIDMVNRMVWALSGRSLVVRFEVKGVAVRPGFESVGGDVGEVLVLGGKGARVAAAAADEASGRAANEPEPFGGFEPVLTNFVQMPKQFFEIVLPGESPVVVAFVAGVVYQTTGIIVNFNTGARREWWEASHGEIGRVCGIASRVSVMKAIAVSRRRGYVVRGRGNVDFTYRLRRFGEPFDDDKST